MAKTSGKKKTQEQRVEEAARNLAPNAKRLDIPEKVKTRKFQPLTVPQETVEDILKSDEFGLLSPDVQELVKTIVDGFTPEQIRQIKLTPQELNNIAEKAVNTLSPYYKRLKKELTQDYDLSLSQDIDTVNMELKYAQNDLKTALDNNDGYTAEQLKIYTQNLRQTKDQLDTEYNTYVTRKNEYLQKKIAETKQDLSTGLGRITDDEARSLRQQERQYTKQLDDLQTGARLRGMTFSSKRFGDEADLETEYVEGKNMTKEQARRQVQDISTQAERLIGTKNLQDVAGAQLTGGVEGDLNTATAQDIADIANKYNIDMRSALQLAEQQIGTGGVQSALGAGYNSQLYGGLEGDVNRTNRTSRDSAISGYQQSVEGKGLQFAQKYNDNRMNKAFGSNFGALAGIYGGYTPEDQRGTATLAYNRSKDQIARDKEFAIKSLKKDLVGNYLTTQTL